MKKSKTLHKWEVPHEKHFLLKWETFLLMLLVFLVAIFSFVVFGGSWIATLLSALAFSAIFLIVTYLSKRFYPIKEHYHITSSGISIKKKTGKKESKVHVKFKDIKKHKLDKFFHGGRIETKDKRHSIYFNTKEEVKKLEKILKNKIKL